MGKDGCKNLAKDHNIAFLGEIPLVQGIREGGDSGYPTVLRDGPAADAFMHIAQNIARQVAIRNASMEETKIVDINT